MNSSVDIMKLLEPITYENIHELQQGEWIWDNTPIIRSVHKRTLYGDTVTEHTGFRLIHVLDLDRSFGYISKPFMLSTFDRGDYEWVYFTEGRFYRFKRNKEEINNDI